MALLHLFTVAKSSMVAKTSFGKAELKFREPSFLMLSLKVAKRQWKPMVETTLTLLSLQQLEIHLVLTQTKTLKAKHNRSPSVFADKLNE